MSVNQAITSHIETFPAGEPFAISRFLNLGSRTAVDKSLSRLVKQGSIERITQGIYIRPKKNRFIGSVKPEISKVIQTIAESNGETIEVHGAEAARRFQLSTQVPTIPIYYTSGSSRTLAIGKLKVKLVHAAPRKLQLAGKKSGVALSALWFLGKGNLSESIVKRVMSKLSPTEKQELVEAEKPAWMTKALHLYSKTPTHV
ncbi:DUF6088 family protein [Pseudoteredinibacter isoporae]|uniref:Transcriptional regulator, AbiEi antitoxin, Type IV TA system n=1 Tax=Pseudoteredinibacter isoporae TaxID=570281 RepID=A0A7X0JU34_9GAMM|nr:DUF6088 family protein [Pseudoteredinibacter isoporae]MBB6522283.1 hypothetical protein [Pseudoteredinibacter isoporae]NHO87816.1 type IV toxin-antitoxin system AbiEi family antitoxin domain-containing protein [Pseudoteredinibacter isoporae]NIB23853.1 type IV toxin-antitoxin system AbiEi family antitoxin domain-containing protein [Pseudoteredinibacter isoporae]